jgi:arylsulfatase A-like enzyme
VEIFDNVPGVHKPTVQEAVKETFGWLDRFGNDPFFLYLHLLDTHNPYTPPEPFQRFGIQEEDLFDGEVRSVDFHIGLLRDYLGQKRLRGKTVLVITADHGEEFQEHGSRYHAKHLYEEVLRVPLIISLPEMLSSGFSIPTQVRSVDIAPTILEILGFPPTENHQGESLVPLVHAELLPHRPSVSQIGEDGESPDGKGEILALTTGDHKLIWHRKDDAKELYHLTTDPQEKHNIAAENQETAQELQTKLQQLIYTPEEKPFRHKSKPKEVTFDEDVLVRLRALGYID